MKAKYTANWGVQIVGMVFQTRSRACLKNALETDTAEKEAIELNCSWSSKEKRIFISLILFRCAKHSILPKKQELEKNESQVPTVRIPQRKVTKCNTYKNSFFFTIVFLQFRI